MWQSEVEFEHYSTMVKNEFITPIKLAGWCASLNYQNYLILKEIWYRMLSIVLIVKIPICSHHILKTNFQNEIQQNKGIANGRSHAYVKHGGGRHTWLS